MKQRNLSWDRQNNLGLKKRIS